MNNTTKTKLSIGKRAVSPLIATVLLIAFAVALGAVVMNWGRGYVEDTANIARERSDTEVKCASDVDISIVEIDGTPQICYNTSGSNYNVNFIVENRKATMVEEVQVRVIGQNTRVPFTTNLGPDSNLTSNQAKLMNASYLSATYGVPEQVKITPVIKVAGQEVTCSQNAETRTGIKTCAEIFG
ncbi:TPA: hypothetical protein HA265_05760 [Candidatus Woesearchaeota archaeon]|nr:hypothetical protein [Candidatus Woesearchaeota archaeon]